MNYKLPGKYKFYSTINNACFVSIRESKNEQIIYIYDNSCIVVSGYGSTIKYKDMFNATVDYFHHHVHMNNVFYFISQMRAYNNNIYSCTLEESLQNHMMNGHWWWEKSGRCGKCGLGCQGSCDREG